MESINPFPRNGVSITGEIPGSILHRLDGQWNIAMPGDAVF
jgi:hypothetical protein